MQISCENTPALDRLPDTMPSDVASLMLSIDRKVQQMLPELCPSLALDLDEHMVSANSSIVDLSISTDIPVRKIQTFISMQSMLDIDELWALCNELGGELLLSIVSRSGKVLHCDEHVRNSGRLTAYISRNLDELDVHPLPKMFFQTCGLESVSGLDGGSLERATPCLFRLMRHALFMRCRVIIRVSFPSTCNFSAKEG